MQYGQIGDYCSLQTIDYFISSHETANHETSLRAEVESCGITAVLRAVLLTLHAVFPTMTENHNFLLPPISPMLTPSPLKTRLSRGRGSTQMPGDTVACRTLTFERWK